MDSVKLSALQSNVRIGGKGTPRRKKKIQHKNTNGDDKKLQSSLKKMNAQCVNGVSDVNIFKDDGTVVHFSAPKVYICGSSNVLSIFGKGEEKEFSDLIPDILTHMGRDSLASLRKLAGRYANSQKIKADDSAEDDDIPDLVEVFDGQD
ncbi:unnamed protein product [Pneumocystis jirovecii]|uniref:Nascent polypeptide-associated complex subunit beta n=2 Tax=Pneumocystis jirovecii TaxID=42068 RepID=L0PB34_PNEJI|nr:uncharacterized protein T551_00758 [Pneumocystis jirovecii RU7]KTW32076.1 hypothetical protein T551_00758 [Pneumocystis jirovecii RU7]CCJ29304.1 unnamed protein product [Pneumocystis jirovecii]